MPEFATSISEKNSAASTDYITFGVVMKEERQQKSSSSRKAKKFKIYKILKEKKKKTVHSVYLSIDCYPDNPESALSEAHCLEVVGGIFNSFGGIYCL